MAVVRNSWGYVGINAKPLRVEFCNVAQCRTFQTFLSYYNNY
jgi:hypothetical protein